MTNDAEPGLVRGDHRRGSGSSTDRHLDSTVADMAPTIIQIGRGPTGTALARQLVPALPPGTRYTVIDRCPTSASLPFGTPVPIHLLNTRANSSSLNISDPDEFQRWMLARSEPGVAPEYPARALYGQYVHDIFDQVVTDAAATGVTVELVSADAVRITRSGARTRVHCADGRTLDADRVVSCPGMMAATHPYPELNGHPGYLADPWRMPPLPPASRVAVIGTRLTAIDVYLTLASRGHTGPVLLASRSGLLPRIRSSEAEAPIPSLQQCVQRANAAGTLRLDDIGQALMADVEAVSTTPPDWSRIRAGGPTTRSMLAAELAEIDAGIKTGWQGVVNAAGPLCLAAWQLLPDSERTELITNWATPLLVHAARMPPPTARRILAGWDSGQLSVLGGLSSVRQRGATFELVTEHGEHEVDAVVNATGGGADEAALRSEPLVANMLDDGLLTVNTHGGVHIDVATFQPLNATGAPVHGIHVVGDLTRGAVLITNDVFALVAQAALAATAIQKDMVEPTLSRTGQP